MNVIISNASGMPIYEQIVSQIKQKILSGELMEGEMLPSIRALAKDLRISVITTKRAYDELEHEGLICRRYRCWRRRRASAEKSCALCCAR